MGERQWTPAQRDAIDARGGTLLVSAAAGSGKTAVLVERLLQRLTDEQAPVPINRLLVVTFTHAAADEMRQRLSARLQELQEQRPTDALLRQQLLMLPTAHISTAHAFCSSLLKEQFPLAELPPDFKVLDERRSTILAEEALTETMEELYAQHDDRFSLWVDRTVKGRDDQDISRMILRLHRFVQAIPFPDQWLAQQEAAADNQSLSGSPFDRAVRRKLSILMDGAETCRRRALSYLDPATPLGEAYLPALESDGLLFAHLAEGIDTLPYDDLRQAFAIAKPDKLKSIRQCADPESQQAVKDWRDRAKGCLSSAQELLESSEEELRFGQQLSAPCVRTLIAALRQFEQHYAAKKEAAHGLDFNDLEHRTLQLLYTEPGVRSPLAIELSSQYEEILIDEYQDTNEVQSALFTALSRDGQNLFYVGDVKQSIYRFRQACPRLFMEQRHAGVPYDGVHYPATVTLGNNFRSRREVTEAVNFTFSLLMRQDTGGIEYDQSEQLVCSAAYPPAEDDRYATELTLIDLPENHDGRDVTEARVIAADIARMMTSLPISEGGTTRPARYRDFCILLRSKSEHADAYVNELLRQGIPASSSGSGGLLETPEVGVLLSLLRLIDNPTQEIALAAVMMSPLYRFSPNEMAEIRLYKGKIPLSSAVRRISREDSALAEKCRRFLADTDHWRRLSPVLPVDQLMERVFEDSSLLEIYSVQPNGSQRVGNLRQLYQLARSFEENGFRGLSAFVRFCDRMEETEQDPDPAAAVSEIDCVSVMSIHHSKGLEFPVVFVAGCGVKFPSDGTEPLLLHQQAGIGLNAIDRETMLSYEPPTRRAISLIAGEEDRAEALRVLYVAMTRAREKLCLIAADDSLDSHIARRALPPSDSSKLSPYAILHAASFEDWLLSVALTHPAGGELRRLALADDSLIRPADFPLIVTVKRPDEVASRPVEQSSNEAPAIDDALYQRWQERLAWRYPYAGLANIPNKLTVSDITHHEQTEEHIAVSQPSFRQKGGLSPAQRGTAMHLFMQYADYTAAAASVEQERDRLADSGWLTPAQATSLDIRRLTAFFASNLYRRMVASPRLMREIAFAAEGTVADFYPTDGLNDAEASERVVVEGVADCLFEENGALVIVDYKTDRVTSGEQLRDRYATQVRLYAQALSKALEMPVKACLLWSFSLGREVFVPFTD